MYIPQSTLKFVLLALTSFELYKPDISNILKRARPSRLERQNVKLALKILHESTYCSQTTFKIEKGIIENNQTVEFLNLISNIWDVFNVIWVGKNIRFNNCYSAPLYPNDSRLSFIQHVVAWLNCWNTLPGKIGKLTHKTFTSFEHTCMALHLLVNRLTPECNY